MITKILQLFKSQAPSSNVANTTTRHDAGDPYQIFATNTEIRSTIAQIQHMDAIDQRVKKIHSRTANAATKGGIALVMTQYNEKIEQHFKNFVSSCSLNNPQKLASDMRALLVEGNLFLQVVSNGSAVQQLVRLPCVTMRVNTNKSGQFKDIQHAYSQIDIHTGAEQLAFALWQITLARLTPENFDDKGSLGRPLLDSARPTWNMLSMTEKDLVLRRRHRAPQRMSHILENATTEELEKYQAQNSQVGSQVTTDYFSNKKGSVTAISGDANLDQIKDITHLLDTFFSGAPAPKGLFGYSDELSRDILEDLKKEFYDELDTCQDIVSQSYYQAFCLHLLLQGINPDDYELSVQFKERRTETANQATDRALKLLALGASKTTALKTAGLNPESEKQNLINEAKDLDAYPGNDAGTPKVSVTPSNARKGESATTVSNG